MGLGFDTTRVHESWEVRVEGLARIIVESMLQHPRMHPNLVYRISLLIE